jgi:hypothetical protein
LSASDIVNTESYKASQFGLSGGIAGIGANKNASPPPQNTGNDGQPDARVGSGGNAIPGIKTGIGTISAGAPSILAASGGQSGTTQAAIAPATIIIAAGPNGAQDAASQAVANSISRDTATANDGALTQEFDAAKRADVQQGFAAAKALTQQTTVFFTNRAAEEQAKKDEATRKDAELAQGIRLGADLKPLLDSNNNRIALTDAERALYNGDAKTEGSVAYLNAQAKSLNDTFGAGSPARILATALNGAAGSNTAGSLGALAQSAAINVLQSLAVSEVKRIADGLFDKDGKPTTQSETVRAALQGVVGCSGAAAGGSGDCTSAAVGASASVVVNNILTSLLNDDPSATLGGQQARTNLVANIAGVLTGALGGDAQSAALAAQIESENNYLTRSQILDRNAQVKRCDGDQACIDRVNDRFASLSATQDLRVAIACEAELSSCTMLSDEQTDYVDGTAFRATGINRIIGDVGDNWVGSNSIKLDAFLKTDIYRSAQLLGGANMTGDEIVVTGTTPFMRQNNIDARYSSDNLDPNSTQAKIYQVLPTLFAQDQSTRQMSALGMATDGQRAIVAQEFAGIRDDLQVVVTTEIAIACGGLSATCAGALTTAAVVDCAQNPGLVSCGAAAAGVAVPVVRVVRGVNASNGANAANAVDDAAAQNTIESIVTTPLCFVGAFSSLIPMHIYFRYYFR